LDHGEFRSWAGPELGVVSNAARLAGISCRPLRAGPGVPERPPSPSAAGQPAAPSAEVPPAVPFAGVARAAPSEGVAKQAGQPEPQPSGPGAPCGAAEPRHAAAAARHAPAASGAGLAVAVPKVSQILRALDSPRRETSGRPATKRAETAARGVRDRSPPSAPDRLEHRPARQVGHRVAWEGWHPAGPGLPGRRPQVQPPTGRAARSDSWPGRFRKPQKVPQARRWLPAPATR
jgi:hypothetical protein